MDEGKCKGKREREAGRGKMEKGDRTGKREEGRGKLKGEGMGREEEKK
jgi:hypothetical protein